MHYLIILKNEALNKQLQDANTKRKSAEKSVKDQAIDANKIIENLEKENKELRDMNNKIKNELEEKDSLIDEEKSRTNAVKDLLKRS